MFDPNAYDVEPRRKFKAGDAAKFLITLLLLIASAKLIYHGPDCDYFGSWNKVLFYGSLIWMVYLVVTLVVQFRNEGMRVFLGYVDYLFILWLLAMWIWVYVLRGNADDSNAKKCAPRWRFASRVYWILGWAILVCILATIVMSVLRMVNSKSTPHKAELALHNSHHHGDYEILDQSAI
jgi:cellulose synthase/poly-beta-1,6-N-acetylglucosamine synthase-like glycosyltransferase